MPPVAATVWLYPAWLTVQSANVVVVSVTAGLTTTVKSWVPTPPTESVAATVKVNVLATVGVPLIIPVLASIV